MLTMRKILCRALLCLCLVLALAPVPAAYAQDLDRIESYDVDVTPDTQDGSLRIQVTLEWTAQAPTDRPAETMCWRRPTWPTASR